jgi:precorrin-6A/cobalt-precorrin-6A reductase
MTLLLLGGTSDAKHLAQQLHQRSLAVTYSIAGLVRQPELECKVVSGGFSQFGGLAKFIKAEGIDAILDATHPYADQMSCIAVQAARDCQIPVWQYCRSPWTPASGDGWHEFEQWSELLPLLSRKRSIFFTAGHLVQEFVDQLVIEQKTDKQIQLLRTAKKPKINMPASMTWIDDIGPFDINQERELMTKFSTDALVSKNSGGSATVAKIVVAWERNIPVFMLKRPVLPAVEQQFSNIESCVDFVVKNMGK